jgi:hypothetical protein
MAKRPIKKPETSAKGRSAEADFDRNRGGLYRGLPKARDPKAEGPAAKVPHPRPR